MPLHCFNHACLVSVWCFGFGCWIVFFFCLLDEFQSSSVRFQSCCLLGVVPALLFSVLNQEQAAGAVSFLFWTVVSFPFWPSFSLVFAALAQKLLLQLSSYPQHSGLLRFSFFFGLTVQLRNQLWFLLILPRGPAPALFTAPATGPSFARPS